MRDNVARVRQLLSEAVEAKQALLNNSTEARIRRQFDLHESNVGAPVLIDQSARARALRQIRRIATWYGWQNEIEAALDLAAVSSVEGLGDDQVAALHQRLAGLEDCAQNALDSPDAPPAR